MGCQPGGHSSLAVSCLQVEGFCHSSTAPFLQLSWDAVLHGACQHHQHWARQGQQNSSSQLFPFKSMQVGGTTLMWKRSDWRGATCQVAAAARGRHLHKASPGKWRSHRAWKCSKKQGWSRAHGWGKDRRDYSLILILQVPANASSPLTEQGHWFNHCSKMLTWDLLFHYSMILMEH